MSKGPGKLQREILDALEPSRELKTYRGKPKAPFIEWYDLQHGPNWVRHLGRVVKLGPEMYDLRAVATICKCSSANLHRAIRSLINRGILSAPELVPLDDEVEYKFAGSMRFNKVLKTYGYYTDAIKKALGDSEPWWPWNDQTVRRIDGKPFLKVDLKQVRFVKRLL